MARFARSSPSPNGGTHLLFGGSFAVGRFLGVRIRIHFTFLLLLAVELMNSGRAWETLQWQALLFLSVLAHEYGHCLACRSVGGRADEILIWPLGGLAFCRPPKRPWAEFITVVWGPLVNAILAIASYLLLWVILADRLPVSWNPLDIRGGARFAADPWTGLLADVFVVNYALLLFNMSLVFYPFDAGRLVQVALWLGMGYERSLRLATVIGMIGACVAALVGLLSNEPMLILIAAFGFLTCHQQWRWVRYTQLRQTSATEATEREFIPAEDLLPAAPGGKPLPNVPRMADQSTKDLWASAAAQARGLDSSSAAEPSGQKSAPSTETERR